MQRTANSEQRAGSSVRVTDVCVGRGRGRGRTTTRLDCRYLNARLARGSLDTLMHIIRRYMYTHDYILLWEGRYVYTSSTIEHNKLYNERQVGRVRAR